MATAHEAKQFHPLPVIGYPEAYYAKHIKDADSHGDKVAHEAYKVGQYITLGLDPAKKWPEKFKYFCHALRHHTAPPAGSDEQTKQYFGRLADLVRRHASHEAVRIAKHESDSYNVRKHAGVPLADLEEEAEVFFTDLLGHGHDCPDWCSKEAWNQLTHIRDQWI